LIHLGLDCRNDVRVPVTEARNRRATTTIEILLARIVVDVDALGTHAARVLVIGATVKNTAHDFSSINDKTQALELHALAIEVSRDDSGMIDVPDAVIQAHCAVPRPW
jgi:hypothetical protein